jgi:hypothetical protein
MMPAQLAAACTRCGFFCMWKECAQRRGTLDVCTSVKPSRAYARIPLANHAEHDFSMQVIAVRCTWQKVHCAGHCADTPSQHNTGLHYAEHMPEQGCRTSCATCVQCTALLAKGHSLNGQCYEQHEALILLWKLVPCLCACQPF